MSQLPAPPPPRMPGEGGSSSKFVSSDEPSAATATPAAPIPPRTPEEPKPITPVPAKAPVPAQAKARRRDAIRERVEQNRTGNKDGDSATISSSDQDGLDATGDPPKPTGQTQEEKDAYMAGVLKNLKEDKPATEGLEKSEGKPEPKIETPTSPQEAPRGQDDPPQDGDPTETERLAKARQSLKLWKWTDEDLDRLPRERILEKGEAAAKSQADFNRVANEKVQSEALITQVLQKMGISVDQLTAPSPSPSAQASEPTAELDTSNLGIQLDKVLESVKDDDLFPGVAGELRTKILDLVSSLKPKVAPPVEKPIEAAPVIPAEDPRTNPELTRLQKDNEEVQIKLARADLKIDIPQLADATVFAKVEDQMYVLSELQGYHEDNGKPKYTELMRDAFAIVSKDDPKPQINEAQLAASYDAQSNGQPLDMGEFNDPKGADPMTNDEKSLLGLKMLSQQRWTPQQIQVHLNKIPSR